METPTPQYETMSLTELVTAMRSLRTEIDYHKELASIAQTQYDVLSKHLVPAKMEEQGVEQIIVTGVGRVNLRADIYASIPADAKQDAYQWLADNGRESLITQTVNASSLKASIREAIKRGEEFPAELFNVTPFTMAVITKT